MSTFVLVHGAFHGAWCWYKVIAGLEAAGHRAIAPDLPGHGLDRTPMETCTLDRYVSTVVAAIEAAEEPVVLVGHSLGGVTVSQGAEHVGVTPGREDVRCSTEQADLEVRLGAHAFDG